MFRRVLLNAGGDLRTTKVLSPAGVFRATRLAERELKAAAADLDVRALLKIQSQIKNGGGDLPPLSPYMLWMSAKNVRSPAGISQMKERAAEWKALGEAEKQRWKEFAEIDASRVASSEPKPLTFAKYYANAMKMPKTLKDARNASRQKIRKMEAKRAKAEKTAKAVAAKRAKAAKAAAAKRAKAERITKAAAAKRAKAVKTPKAPTAKKALGKGVRSTPAARLSKAVPKTKAPKLGARITQAPKAQGKPRAAARK